MSYIYPSQKNNITRYKVYFVYRSKKIYLGLYSSKEVAENALLEANQIMEQPIPLTQYTFTSIDYKKFISLCNFRDHHVYIKNPVYIYDTYFCYHLSQDIILTFDMKDLFFFSTYKISKRGRYFYTQDSITQQSILSRFGIPPHSVNGVDYRFKNGCDYDFRRENLEIINSYKGVTRREKNNQLIYIAKIFVHHNIIIGHYTSQLEAAIAYNKAIDILLENGIQRDYVKNTIPYLTLTEYTQIYDNIDISPCLKTPSKQKRIVSLKQYRGICKDKSGFRAVIGYKGKQVYLGIYPTEKRAAQAYNLASFYLYGNSGYINDIQPLIYDHDSEKIASKLAKHHIKKINTKAPMYP
ncbi:hypothetical protein [Cellulosilyticum sp. I15G10I2]|uniref:hypothetical protein n=1 Tax=Cellulosilyticum sp. I15G10I2 TaxID=1892843 RepID=UPI00085CDAA0|nr:hypothetical protein [Cellulosilyticum sp. I15G10I2]